MTKRDFFGKHNGYYERKFKDGGYAVLRTTYSLNGDFIFYGIEISRNGHFISKNTLRMDGFRYAWRIFQDCMREARTPYRWAYV